MKILLIDDELSMQTLIRDIVVDAAYEFCGAMNGAEGIEMALAEKPDIIILDVMMPDIDGFETCVRLREMGVKEPIIFLSAKGDIIDKGVGFRAGGDDYLVKPFDTRELLMHINAHLRRQAMNAQSDAADPVDDVIVAEDMVFDCRRHLVTKNDVPIELTPKEFTILTMLARKPGVVFSKEQLIERVWGSDYVGATTSLTVFVRKIREKIEDDPANPRHLQTVWGIGYRFGDG